MASNYTTNYELPLRAADDAFLRTEFNDANQKIDAALGARAQSAGNCRIVTGSYTGTGEYGSAHPNTLTFDGPPLLLFVGKYWQFWAIRGSTGAAPIGGGNNVQSVTLTWNGNTVQWYSSRSETSQLNEAQTTYHYLALLKTDVQE